MFFVSDLALESNPSDHPRASTIFLSKSQTDGKLTFSLSEEMWEWGKNVFSHFLIEKCLSHVTSVKILLVSTFQLLFTALSIDVCLARTFKACF